MSRSQMVHIQKRRKTVISSYLETRFVMFPEYIYKPFEIFTKIIIVTIENYIKPVGEIDV